MIYYAEIRITLKRAIAIIFSKRGNAGNTTLWPINGIFKVLSTMGLTRIDLF